MELKSEARPWSRDDFLARVSTFSPARWFAKPSLLSPLQCARFGWVNTGSNLVKCTQCNSTLAFADLSSLLPAFGTFHEVSLANCAPAQKAARTYHEQLHTSHKIYCPWRDNACDISFLQLPEPAVQHFQQRLGTFRGYKHAFIQRDSKKLLVYFSTCCLTNFFAGPSDQRSW